MRLTEFEIKSILEISHSIFGKDSIVSLFGSRVDDNKLGGDIDILIEPEIEDFQLRDKYSFLVNLKTKIGDQKIDLVISNGDESQFVKSIKKNRIILK